MIILDTHIWVWWVHDDTRLTKSQLDIINANEANVIGISAISIWEVAKLVERKRLILPCSVKEWFDLALSYPAVRVMELTEEIAIESTQLPGEFHQDPADQIIVATARIQDCPLVTSDNKIINYPHVEIVS